MNNRAPIYEGIATYICDVETKSVAEISSEIAIAYELRGKGENHE
jgi:hypothetical protein